MPLSDMCDANQNKAYFEVITVPKATTGTEEADGY